MKAYYLALCMALSAIIMLCGCCEGDGFVDFKSGCRHDRDLTGEALHPRGGWLYVDPEMTEEQVAAVREAARIWRVATSGRVQWHLDLSDPERGEYAPDGKGAVIGSCYPLEFDSISEYYAEGAGELGSSAKPAGVSWAGNLGAIGIVWERIPPGWEACVIAHELGHQVLGPDHGGPGDLMSPNMITEGTCDLSESEATRVFL